jgi:uncharacterized protein YyaL (SSP411 family)
MPNALADAASPYLRSHAENPVDWRQWGPEPFAEAARRDVPVMVSIGYSTCHWCHVMARESFSDPAVAAYMNENLVAIKVDREEHAEVDSTYLAAAGAFTPNLGWPLNVFVTPEGRAFFAGTYWPPQPVGGHPAFRQVLEAVLDAWRERRAEVEGNGAAILEGLSRVRLDESPLVTDFAPIVSLLESQEDTEFGGFGAAPKFPVAPVLHFLLERGSTGDAAAQALATRTLDAMASSDLRDRVDGGFFRYATRRDWSEPHYERMLYDNAQLVASYAIAGRADIAEGIADFLIGTLQLPDGGFASAQDSESIVDGQRVEGFYYSLDAASRERVQAPALDEKVITGWNGLAIEGLATAGTLLDRPDWIAAAVRAADFLLEHHVLPDRLVRTSIGGTLSSARATLEDHGMLASGLLHLALATGEVRFAVAAKTLVDDAIAAGDPFGVPGGADPVLAAQGLAIEADPSDGAHPSGLSAMASAGHLLYLMTAHAPYRAASERGMSRVAGVARRQPVSLGGALAVMSALAEPVRQLVVVADDGAAAVASRARSFHRSGAVSSLVSSAQAAAFAAAGFELYEGRSARDGAATAYVCEEFVCRLPVTSADELATLLS